MKLLIGFVSQYGFSLIRLLPVAQGSTIQETGDWGLGKRDERSWCTGPFLVVHSSGQRECQSSARCTSDGSSGRSGDCTTVPGRRRRDVSDTHPSEEVSDPRREWRAGSHTYWTPTSSVSLSSTSSSGCSFPPTCIPVTCFYLSSIR